MHLRLWVCVASLAGTIACGSTAKSPATPARGQTAEQVPPPPPFFDLIPANTAYALASIEPWPDELVQQWFGLGTGMETLVAALRDARHRGSFEKIPAHSRFLFAFLEELDGNLSVEALNELGLDPTPRFAAWGMGLLPVARLELADGERFRATMQRVLDRAGIELTEQTIDGQRYWWMEDVMGIAVAIVDDELALAVVPPDRKAAVLPYALGIKRPEKSMADTRELAELQARYGFDRNDTVGFVNLVRVAEALTSTGRGVHDVVWRDRDILRDPACAREFPALFEAVPRVAFGWDDISVEHASGRTIVETRPDITDKLARMVTPVPGLSAKATEDVAMSFGIGIHVGMLTKLIATKADAFANAEHKCPELADLEPEMGKLSTQLASLQMTPFAGIRGVNVMLSRLDLENSDGAGIAIVAADSPPLLWNLISNFWPALSGVTVKAGAPPTELKNLGLPAAFSPVHIAMSHDAIGISVGSGENHRLAQILASAPVADPPLLLYRVDSGLMQSLESLSDDTDELARIDPELSAAINRASTSIPRRSLATATITDQGIVFSVRSDAVMPAPP